MESQSLMTVAVYASQPCCCTPLTAQGSGAAPCVPATAAAAVVLQQAVSIDLCPSLV